MEKVKLKTNILKREIINIFKKFGLSNNHSIISANALINSELVGAYGHGLSRLKMYCDRINKKLINPSPKIKIKKISQSISQIDADNSIGFVAADIAIKEAIKNAKKTGIGLVGIKKSGHYGMSGYYAEQAVKKNLIVFCFTNAPPAIAPYGARKSLFGTNPVCFGTPTSSKVPFILDTSVSMINRGVIRVAARLGKKIPAGVALDKNGNLTTDAKKALKGVQLPIAGFRGSGKVTDYAPNLSKYRNDDDLETKTLDRTLTVAVLIASLLTIMIPLYYLGEQDRQEGFVEEFDEVSVERGEHLYEEFGCGNCHGVDGSGGAASYVEKRSGINVTWTAPAINNVFYRYDDEEVRYWLIYGRANSPMPAWGLEGGGPMNDGQLDDLIEYMHHFQISQSEELQTIEMNINSSLSRLDTSELLVENEIARQKELIQSVKDAPGKLPVVQKAVEDVSALLSKEGGIDTDEDGLSDSTETELSAYSSTVSEVLGTSILNLDPDNEESIPGRKDKSVASGYLSQLESELINITIVAEGYDKFIKEAETGLAFLEKALEEKLWEVSFDEIADSTFDGDLEKAKRAVGLFNAYCARCHTAGYSAGVAYTKEIASGGLGPALRAGRANIQFKQREDLIDFIVKGSVNGKAYGVNGVGGGKMPGFGAVLPQSDIELIIDYLRGMTPDA